MRRGEIVTAVLPGNYGKPRPALIVQESRFLEQATILLAPFTTHLLETSEFRIRIEPDGENGLRLLCDLMLDKISPVPREKIDRIIGALPEPIMRRINRALVLFLGLAPSAPPPAP